MKLFKRTLSLLLAAALLLSGIAWGGAEAAAVSVDSYIASCTKYASNMSIRTTAATPLMTYPCTAATESGSAVSSTAASDTKLTATALYKNTAGEYWYQVGTNQYVNAADTVLVAHLTSDVQVTDVVSPASLGYGKSFSIGGTVSASVNTLGTVTAAMYTGTDLTQTPAISASAEPAGQSYSLSGSTISSSLSFSSLAKADYTYLLTADAIGYYVKDGVLTESVTTVILEQKKCIINGAVDASTATAMGIDVSTWQGDIDWSKVCNQVDFAIFRSSYSTTTDDQFYNNLNGCVTYGVPFGVYVYSYATTVAQVKAEAEYVLSLIEGYDLAFPVFLDMEEADQGALSNSTKLAIVKAFVEVIEAGGYEAGLYSSLSWYNSYYTDPYYNTLFKWVAQIYSVSQYTGGTRMWQYSWTGSFDGINGDVDCNYYYGELPTKTSGGTLTKPKPGDYRWETVDNALTSSTTGGATYNQSTLTTGSVSGGTFSEAQYSLEQSITLNHDEPWVLEWKSAGVSDSVMLLSSRTNCYNEGSIYVYRRNNSSLIAIGNYSGGYFHNYGMDLSNYGIDASTAHVYRMENRINDDGSNMVYFYLDGEELGPLNKHYIGGTYQNETSDWISGKDFRFPYLGSYNYGLNACTLEYLQIWGTGETDQPDEYRWETVSDGLTDVAGKYTENTPTIKGGTCANGSFDDAYFKLSEPVVLLHDREWSIEWQSEGSWYDSTNGALLFASSNIKSAPKAAYLYRRHNSELIALGNYDSYNKNYGICLSDYGVDGTASHIYRLVNRINADGSNMVYLYVDGQELGALNNYYVGGVSQGTTSNWVSGKDFVFPYVGCAQFPISSCSIDYIQVDEGVTKTGIVEFRDWDGTLLSSKEYTYGDAVAAPTAPSRAADETYRYAFAGWDKQIVVCEGDAVYTATYTAEYIDYTVEFRNYDGTLLSTATYHYGDAVTAPAAPTRADEGGYRYTFDGWDFTVTACKGDAVYTATYTAAVIATITPKYPSLSFEGEIFYNVYFETTGMNGVPLEDMGLISWTTPQPGGTIENAGTITPGAEQAGNGYYSVRSAGIPAKNLGDNLYFKVYAKLSDGTYVYSDMYYYSAKTYAEDRLANSTSEKMKALCVAMLNYGAAAQTHWAYKPYNLMNKDLTAEQQALVQTYDSSMVTGLSGVDSSKVGGFAYNSAGFTSRYPSVSFEGAFSINYYFTPARVPDAGMTLYYWDQETYNSVSVLTAGNATGKLTMTPNASGAYEGAYEGIAAKDIDATVYVAGVYESSDVSFSTGVLPYSLGAYCVDRAANGSETMRVFAAATAVYGYYAKQYFA